MQSKVCRKCGIEKPVSEFHKHPENKDGLQSYCKYCSTHFLPRKTPQEKAENLARMKERKKQAKAYDESLPPIERAEYRLGGYKAYILNRATGKEKIYNVVRTTGEVFKTNDKKEFIRFLEAI